MNYTITFRRDAVADFNAACHWYRDKSSATEDRFKVVFRQKIKDIGINPEAYTIRFIGSKNEEVRAIALKKFPYLIFYFIDDLRKRIRVIAIWHNARSREPQS
jgi:plasmid stabilization system protein ParE